MTAPAYRIRSVSHTVDLKRIAGRETARGKAFIRLAASTVRQGVLPKHADRPVLAQKRLVEFPPNLVLL